MEGMIGELKVADLMGSTAIQVRHPGVYTEEMSAASNTGEDGEGLVVDADGNIKTEASEDATPETAAARTKADILIESIALSEQSSADSFDFADPAPQADGGDEDGTIVWELGEGAFAGADAATGLAPIEATIVPEAEADSVSQGNVLIISEDA